jgi:hypothetical protein
VTEEINETVESLPLDPDEAKHMALIPENTQTRLALSNDGAQFILAIVQEAGENCQRGSSSFFMIRSLIRVANFTRFAVIGLSIGYYSGAAAQLRMAYESLLYAFLFKLYPEKTELWLQTSLDVHMDKVMTIETEQKMLTLAKKAFNRWTGEKDLGKEIWESASNLMHHSVESLALEAGLQSEQLLSQELLKSLEATQGDFDAAVKLSILFNKFGDSRTKKTETENENLPWVGETGGLFDIEWLDLWSTITLYIVHRATDFTYDMYPPSDKEMKKSYQEWHHAVKSST